MTSKDSEGSLKTKKKKYFVVLDIVGLDVAHLDSFSKEYTNITGLIGTKGEYGYLKPVFPSVTCTVQSSILTGRPASEHGIVSNGYFDRENLQTLFWEQSTNLVQSEKIWDIIKNSDKTYTTALLFWQNSMYTTSDIVITPRPIHLENGQVDMWCYSKPVNYYEEVMGQIGEFNLMNYWGPFASINSSEWISKATEYTIEKYRPNLLFTYFPQLDYSAQKFGKNSSQVLDDLKTIDTYIGNIIQKIKDVGIFDQTEFLILSEYSFNEVNEAIPINRIFREKGLLKIRTIKGKEYIDFEYSDAFAMVDHQIAHIYLRNKDSNSSSSSRPNKSDVKKMLEEIDGIDKVCNEREKEDLKINHPRSGELVAIADKDKWFSYYWWYENENSDKEDSYSQGQIEITKTDKAPSFTKTVDIHRKPGYDPLDLFFDPFRKSISRNTSLIKGSHGRPPNLETGEGLSAFVSSSKINNIQKESFNGHSVINCTDIYNLIKEHFV